MATSPRPKAEMAPVTRDHRPDIVGPPKPENPYPMQLRGVVTRGFGRGARFLGIPTANLPDSSLGPLNELQMTGIYYGFARVHPSVSTPLPTPSASGASTPVGAQHAHDFTAISSPLNPSTTSAQSAPPTRKHPSSPKSLRLDPLSAEHISALPAATAPYPPDSVPGDTFAPKRLSEEDGRVWPMVMSVGWNPYFKNEKITAEVHIMHPFRHDFYGHDMSVLVLGYIRPELDYVSKEALIEDIQFDVKVALNSLARDGYASYASDPFLMGA